MAVPGRADQTQRSGAARSANDENITSFNDLTTSKAVTLVFEGMPFPVAIQSLQDLQFVRAGKFDGSEQCIAMENRRLMLRSALRRTANPIIGESLISA